MAITCPTCGTQFDVTLFEFNRGIRCDCGTWVDLSNGHMRSTHPTVPTSNGTDAMKIHSPAFPNGGRIPAKYTGDGDDISPPLGWEGVPEGTKELTLICDDPDAPTPESWVHWVIYKIPADRQELPDEIPTEPRLPFLGGALQGRNSWQSGPTIGYRGPAPPHGHGVHHYHFKLYSLGAELDLEPSMEKRDLLKAIAGHTTAEAELVGTYER